MIIKNTDFEAQHPWPENVLVQGGKAGLVLMEDEPNYLTAFVEAFPNTFLRGEGATLAEAEDKVWAQFQQLLACPTYPAHGPFERRQYRNGSGYCTSCGAWFSGKVTGFDELPDDPKHPRPKSSLEILFEHAKNGETEKVAQVWVDANLIEPETVGKLIEAMENGDYETFKDLMLRRS